MKLDIVNCTPHKIVIRTPSSEDIVIEPSGYVARVITKQELRQLDGCPIPIAEQQISGEIIGLPEPAPNTLYVVSAVVLSALRGTRPDVVSPGTGPNDGAIRENGQVVAVTRFVTLKP